MDRLIVPKSAGLADTAKASADPLREPSDSPSTRLIKYIPAEIISGYTVFWGVVEGASQGSPLQSMGGWLAVASGTLLTPVYLWKVGKPKGLQWWQLPISTMSFVLWAYALGGPFVNVRLFGYAYEKWFAALLAGVFSWGVAIVWDPEETQ